MPGDLPREAAVDATGDIEAGQLVQLGVAVVGQLAALARQVRPLGIGLRADGEVFPAAIDIALATSPEMPAIRTRDVYPARWQRR